MTFDEKENFACGTQNPGLWNPLFNLRNPESRQLLQSGIQVPLTRNPKSTACNPESKTSWIT